MFPKTQVYCWNNGKPCTPQKTRLKLVPSKEMKGKAKRKGKLDWDCFAPIYDRTQFFIQTTDFFFHFGVCLGWMEHNRLEWLEEHQDLPCHPLLSNLSHIGGRNKSFNNGPTVLIVKFHSSEEPDISFWFIKQAKWAFSLLCQTWLGLQSNGEVMVKSLFKWLLDLL